MLLEQFQCGNEEKEEVTTTTTAWRWWWWQKRWRGAKQQWAERCFHVIKYNYFRVYSIRIAIFFSFRTFAPFLIPAHTRLTDICPVYALAWLYTPIPEWVCVLFGPQLPSRYFSFQFRFSSSLYQRDPLFWLLNTFVVRIPEHCIGGGVLIKSTHIISYYLLYGLLHYERN